MILHKTETHKITKNHYAKISCAQRKNAQWQPSIPKEAAKCLKQMAGHQYVLVRLHLSWKKKYSNKEKKYKISKRKQN